MGLVFNQIDNGWFPCHGVGLLFNQIMVGFFHISHTIEPVYYRLEPFIKGEVQFLEVFVLFLFL